MKTIHEENMEAIGRLLDAIPEWETHVLFIGGATLGFHVETTFHDTIRVTKDIDVLLEIATLTEHRVLGERLRGSGFVEQLDYTTRWKKDDLIVDVLPLQLPEYLSPKPFLQEVFQRGLAKALPDGRQIFVPGVVDFIALKLHAHEERGQGDWLAKDMEDVVTVIDAAPEPFLVPAALSEVMKSFLITSLSALRSNADFQNLMPGLLPVFSAARAQRFNRRIETLLSLLSE